jgi:hypothetical protein
VNRPQNDCSWLQISTAQPGYAGDVVTLVARISRTRCGRDILTKIRASGQVVKIEKPAAPTRPANAWARLDTATPSAILIAFDPADWRARTGRWAGDAVLLGLLCEAHALAIGAEGTDVVSAVVEAYLGERSPSPASA